MAVGYGQVSFINVRRKDIPKQLKNQNDQKYASRCVVAIVCVITIQISAAGGDITSSNCSRCAESSTNVKENLSVLSTAVENRGTCLNLPIFCHLEFIMELDTVPDRVHAVLMHLLCSCWYITCLRRLMCAWARRLFQIGKTIFCTQNAIHKFAFMKG